MNFQEGFWSILNSIHDAFIDNEFLPEEDDDLCLRTFTVAYKVSEAQAKILALLAHCYPLDLSRNELLRTQDETNIHDVDEAINDLYERGFLYKHPTGGNFNYAITLDARRNFKEEILFGRKIFPDCYKELKSATLKTILERKWVEAFYESAEASKDGQLAKAISTLGVKEWSADVQDAFWVLIWQFVNRFTSPFVFNKSGGSLPGTELSPFSFNKSGESLPGTGKEYSTEKMKVAMGELVKMGMAVTIPIELFEGTGDTERYLIAVKPVELMFHGHEEFIRYEEISKQANVIFAKDIVEKELFFPEEIQKEVDNLRKMISPEGFRRAKEILRQQKRNPGIQSLFWGPPGTGKTEVIKQLARESGRDIVMHDAAKATGSLLGESEKFYRSLFLGYSYMVAVSDNAPILVLNEADQLLSRRLSDVGTAIARTENTISDIVLQCFEDMSGILLASTNLAGNMDDAFDRRFLFKTELVRPDNATRQKIWKSSIPELTDEESGRLAAMFDLSGGQISNVVAKRNLAALYYDGDRDFRYIVDLCSKEAESPIKGTVHRIGF